MTQWSNACFRTQGFRQQHSETDTIISDFIFLKMRMRKVEQNIEVAQLLGN